MFPTLLFPNPEVTMPTFQTTDYWFILGVIGYAIALVGGVLYGVYRGTHSKQRHAWMSGLLAFVSLVVVFNAITWAMSHHHSDNDWVSPSRAAAVFGLKPGTSYPLELGSRLGGTQVKAEVYGGHFTAFVSVSAAPASAVSVGFTHDGVSSIMELPTSKITFVQRPGVSPSMTIVLDDSYDSDSQYGEVIPRVGPCRFVVESGYASCKQVVTWETRLTAATKRRGLADVVMNHIDSARLVVTPEMYQAILLGK